MGGYPPDEFGELVQGPQKPQGGGWTGLLQDPRAQAALLQTGLQLMMGGWGNGTQQLAQALGAGASAAAGVDASMKEEDRYQDKLDEQAMARGSREREAELNRTSRQEIAGMQAANKMEIEGLKNDYRFARLNAIHGPSSAKEQQLYNTTYNTIYRKEKDNQIISRKTDDQIRLEAELGARQALESGRKAVQGQGRPEVTDEQIAPGAKPGAAAPGAQTPIPSFDVGLFPPKLIIGQDNVALDRMKNDPKFGAQFRADLETPQGRAKIKQMNPQLKAVIERVYGAE